jgi:hypothetical protein
VSTRGGGSQPHKYPIKLIVEDAGQPHQPRFRKLCNGGAAVSFPGRKRQHHFMTRSMPLADLIGKTDVRPVFNVTKTNGV